MKKNNAGFIQIILILVIVVLVGGGMYYMGTLKNKTNDVVETPTEEPSTVETQRPNIPTVKPTIDPTANWKTYSSSEIGFELKYPTTSIVSKDGWQKIGSNEKGNWVLEINDQTLKTDFFVDYRENPKTAGGKSITKAEDAIQGVEYEKITFNNLPAIRFNTSNIGGMLSTGIYVLNNNKLWYIYILDWESTEKTSSKFDQILSTFKFTK